MDFAPEIIDGAVVINAVEICTTGTDCRPCSELAVGIHNWIVAHNLQYLIVDFQDEKVVCPAILTEILQLRKRLQYPFIFCGIMTEPKKFLESYAYNDHPVFDVPEEAVNYLKTNHPERMMLNLANIREHELIPYTRSRHYRVEDEPVEPEQEVETETEI